MVLRQVSQLEHSHPTYGNANVVTPGAPCPASSWWRCQGWDALDGTSLPTGAAKVFIADRLDAEPDTSEAVASAQKSDTSACGEWVAVRAELERGKAEKRRDACNLQIAS